MIDDWAKDQKIGWRFNLKFSFPFSLENSPHVLFCIFAECTHNSDCNDSLKYCDIGRCQCKKGFIPDMKKSGLCKFDINSTSESAVLRIRKYHNFFLFLVALTITDLAGFLKLPRQYPFSNFSIWYCQNRKNMILNQY